MDRLKEMRGYLPEFLLKFRELDQVLITEAPEFELIMDKLKMIQDQLYIETATDEGLKKYESFLGIIPSTTDINIRRTNVLALWYSDMPFTIKTLIQRLSVLQGDDNVDAWVEVFLLHVKTDLVSAEEITNARKIIDSMIPANLGLQFDFESVFRDVMAWFGIAALYSTSTTYKISGINANNYNWLVDELDATLTDELGIILFND